MIWIKNRITLPKVLIQIKKNQVIIILLFFNNQNCKIINKYI